MALKFEVVFCVEGLEIESARQILEDAIQIGLKAIDDGALTPNPFGSQQIGFGIAHAGDSTRFHGKSLWLTTGIRSETPAEK